MRNLIRHLPRRDEQGQVLLIVAGGLVVFLLLAGLVIDTGIGFRERRTSQNISDLSSMAGTRIIANMYLDPSTPVDGSDVYAAVAESATNNGCANPCTWEGVYVKPVGTGVTTDLGPLVDGGTIPAGAQGVRVRTDRHPQTFFMKLVGISTLDVGAEATALTSQLEPPPSGVLLPIGVFDADYEVGTNYTLTEGSHGPGNFGWISWLGSPSNPTLVASLCFPDNPAFTFPTWFDGATGVMNSSGARACLDQYIADQTVVYVPIWRQTNDRGGSNLQYEVIGVAAFVLTGYDRHAVTVSGNFQEFYSYPSVPAGFGAPPCTATTDPTCNERTNFIGLVQ
ncbi:MAG TPA: pilus assembly protein TadG-related protein [Gemmatimonadales bacterium]|nr:pilus assembly protein TadG-related protein [Gemmatimonadales bacterium]